MSGRAQSPEGGVSGKRWGNIQKDTRRESYPHYKFICPPSNIQNDKIQSKSSFLERDRSRPEASATLEWSVSQSYAQSTY